MPAVYPTDFRVFTTKIDLTDIVYGAHMNDVQEEIVAIERTLGRNPQGTAATVAARLAAMPTVSQGVFSSRPAVGTSQRLYFATDRRILYYDDGTTWNEAGGSGGGGFSRVFLTMGA